MHRLQTLEDKAKSEADSTAANGGQKQINETDATKESDSMLLEKEMLITHFQEQVRMMTAEMDELKASLQMREMEHCTLMRVVRQNQDREIALNREIADLKDMVASLENGISELEEGSGCTEQRLAKKEEELKWSKAALNTCRKRLKHLESSSVGDYISPEEETPSVERLTVTVDELCASVKVAHISEDVSQQQKKIMYISLKDSLCQTLKAVEQRLKDI